MEAFLVSTLTATLAEVGDKSQLLALMLVARFRRPWIVVLGILAATVINHGVAGLLGSWIATLLGPQGLRWLVGGAFLAMAAWAMIPDKMGQIESRPRLGVFGAVFIAFFFAEMGDKTQVATVALAAQFQAVVPVVAGTTLGMMIANVPVVLLGHRLVMRIHVRAVRLAAALVFAALGLAALLGLDEALGL
jgi:Ca2+/H+ antiporter, TMEM165/GDT1 family